MSQARNLEIASPSLAPCLQAPVLLHGVDVSGSRFFGRTSVQRAANFAAEAHRCLGGLLGCWSRQIGADMPGDASPCSHRLNAVLVRLLSVISLHCCRRGQVRKTREPYVTHCIETALVVEGLLSPTEDDER